MGGAQSGSVMTASQQIGVLISGAFAGVSSRTLTAPLERLKTLVQTQTNQNAVTLGRNIVQTQGVRSLWRGNLANCLKVAPVKAVKFLGYEVVKNLVCQDPMRPSFLESFS